MAIYNYETSLIFTLPAESNANFKSLLNLSWKEVLNRVKLHSHNKKNTETTQKRKEIDLSFSLIYYPHILSTMNKLSDD